MKRRGTELLTRFGVALEGSLLSRFDAWVSKKGYPNRTEGFRELIRRALVEEEWDTDQEVAGSISLVYDHHKRDLLANLAHAQHDHPGLVVAAQHIHLDHHDCLEILAVRGRAKAIQRLFAVLRSVKGIKRSALTPMSVGKHLP